MSPTGPRPADVAFDHGAAAEAIGALDLASAVLDDVAESRSRASATARKQFRGVYADDFVSADRVLGQTSSDARSAVSALRSTIEAAAEAARAAQAARVLDQQAWDVAHAHPPPVGVG